MGHRWLDMHRFEIWENAKWTLIKILGGVVVAAAYILLHRIRHLEFDWWVATGLFTVSLVLFFFLAKRKKDVQLITPLPMTSADPASAIPSTFDVGSLFPLAYYSPLQAEVEQNIRNAASTNQLADREGFYLKCLSLAVISYNYDKIWHSIHRSQLIALVELSKNDGFLPLSQIKLHYERAADTYPNKYMDVSLERWLQFLVGNRLAVRQPGEMVEITVGGMDFLRYLSHWGREVDQRRF
jgi:hypothetical protein